MLVILKIELQVFLIRDLAGTWLRNRIPCQESSSVRLLEGQRLRVNSLTTILQHTSDFGARSSDFAHRSPERSARPALERNLLAGDEKSEDVHEEHLKPNQVREDKFSSGWCRKLLGHDSVTTTQRYVHPEMKGMAEMVNERNSENLRHTLRHTGITVQ